ncbi:MAG: hypothetical protein QNJ98_11295 [Planctomycetota bacterium]|nr:hypothetical protein [Planctomycetota bacterium]
MQVRQLVVVLVLLLLGGPMRAAAEDDQNRRAAAAQAAVKAIERARELAALQDIDAIYALADHLMGAWDEVDPDLSTKCTIRIASVLGSVDFDRGEEAEGASQELAMRELERRSDVGPRLRFRLAVLIVTVVDGGGKTPEGQALARHRSKLIEIWVQTWALALDALDAKWDPKRKPDAYPTPPDGYEQGVRPERIKDEAVRGKYASALARQRERLRAWEYQEGLRKDIKRYVPALTSRIAGAARLHPALRRHQLEAALRPVSDRSAVAALLDEVHPPTRAGK